MDDVVEMEILRALEISPIGLKLTKNSAGYGWEISIRGKNIDECFKQLKEADDKLRETWGRLK